MNADPILNHYSSGCGGSCHQGRQSCDCSLRMPQAGSACSEFLTENSDQSDQDGQGAGWELLGAALFIVSGIAALWVLA